MNCLKLLLDLTDRLKLSRVALSSVVFVKGKCYYFFAPCCVNVNIWCLGLLWLDMHSHSQLQTLCPSCRPLLDRTCDSAWAPPPPGHCCHFPPAAEFHTGPLFTTVLQWKPSQEEKPQGEWQKYKAKHWFSASASPPHPPNSPHSTSIRK